MSCAGLRLWFAAMGVVAIMACQQGPSPLLAPQANELDRPAPDSFKVNFETSKGNFVVQAVRAWSPHGVDRFHWLVQHHFYDGVRFFRVLPNFVVQFGINGDPKVAAVWEDRTIPDDSVRQSNQESFVSYAKGGPNTRTTQLFINKRDNRRLDTLGFAPIGRVIEGMPVVLQLFGEYGEGPPRGRGPSQDSIRLQGNRYLMRAFPALDSVVRARVVRN